MRDVRRAYAALKSDQDEIERTLRMLAAANWLTASGAGRWAVNAAVHRRFAERAREEASARDETRRKIAEAAHTLRQAFEDV